MPYRIILAVLFVGTSALPGQTDGCAQPSSTSDVQFTLSLKDNRTIFHEGEIIPLVLSFSSGAESPYEAADRNYDRSGRLDIESYCEDPHSPDPLETYFRGGTMGGGIGGEHKLDTTPFTAGAELNEWRRLAPGHYRVFAVSHRVWRPSTAADRTPYSRTNMVLRSNTVEVDVTAADPEWQAEQLRAAVQTLTSPAPAEDARHAAHVLRFLDTQESTRQMARLFGALGPQKPFDFDLMLGLFGSPFRRLAVYSLRAEFPAPNHAITADFLNALVRLQQDGVEQAMTSALMNAEMEKVAAALPFKTAAARAITLNGLLLAAGSNRPVAPTIRSALIASWPELPLPTQEDLIQYRWQLIGGPDMLPILRRVVAEPPSPANTTPGLTREAALRHIFELDPEAGRVLIVHEATDPRARPSIGLMKLLPAPDIARIVKTEVEELANGAREFDYELLDRYADAGALDAVRQMVERNPDRWSCGSGPSVLRYLLRVDPAYGASQVQSALRSRKASLCYKHLLQNLGDQLPAVQEIAIKALDDPDPDLAGDALLALGNWGSAKIEAGLWERLRNPHGGLEQALTTAIATGTGWICPPDRLTSLGELVTTFESKRQIQLWIKEWGTSPAAISSDWPDNSNPTFSVLQYGRLNEKQLAIKIAQFPQGTQLLWQFSKSASTADQESAYERMRNVAEEHGVTLGMTASN